MVRWTVQQQRFSSRGTDYSYAGCCKHKLTSLIYIMLA